MSTRPFSHLHRDISQPHTVVVHSPGGRVNGYIRTATLAGTTRKVFVPCDEHRFALSDYELTRDRAWEIVNER